MHQAANGTSIRRSRLWFAQMVQQISNRALSLRRLSIRTLLAAEVFCIHFDKNVLQHMCVLRDDLRNFLTYASINRVLLCSCWWIFHGFSLQRLLTLLLLLINTKKDFCGLCWLLGDYVFVLCVKAFGFGLHGAHHVQRLVLGQLCQFLFHELFLLVEDLLLSVVVYLMFLMFGENFFRCVDDVWWFRFTKRHVKLEVQAIHCIIYWLKNRWQMGDSAFIIFKIRRLVYLQLVFGLNDRAVFGFNHWTSDRKWRKEFIWIDLIIDCWLRWISQ